MGDYNRNTDRGFGRREYGGGGRGFDRGGNRSGRSGGYGRGGFNRRDDRPREMFHAVCDDCGNTAEVPFKPTGEKPIYCNNCFKNHKDERGDSKRSENRPTAQDNSQFTAQLNSINTKLDRLLRALEIREIKEPTIIKKEAPVEEKVVKKKPVKPASRKRASDVKTNKPKKSK